MQVLAPDYYNHFSCIAAACPDSCCKEWTVDVDDASAAMYRALPGPLGDRLRAVLKAEDGSTVMSIQDGRCPMWRRDGLCQIQAQLGHDALCQTCRDYPRLRHDYGSFIELGLELSCPEAARLILAGFPGTVVTEHPGPQEECCDPELMPLLLQSRQQALEFLRTTPLPLPQAFAAILLYAHSVQGELDGGEAAGAEMDSCLKDAERFAGPGDIQAVLDFFLGLELLTERWHARLQAPAAGSGWSEGFRALMAYFIGRYWLQAVSDGDLVGRVKFAVTACILIHAMGGDLLSTAQLFSKEIENDPDNLETILDGCYRSPALTDANLLGLLLKA